MKTIKLRPNSPSEMTDKQLLKFLRANITPTLSVDAEEARAAIKEAKARLNRLELTQDELIFISLVNLS